MFPLVRAFSTGVAAGFWSPIKEFLLMGIYLLLVNKTGTTYIIYKRGCFAHGAEIYVWIYTFLFDGDLRYGVFRLRKCLYWYLIIRGVLSVVGLLATPHPVLLNLLHMEILWVESWTIYFILNDNLFWTILNTGLDFHVVFFLAGMKPFSGCNRSRLHTSTLGTINIEF